MGDNYEWELSKENIQPLKHGRNIGSLLTALTVGEDHAKHQRNEQRKAMELDIMAYDGSDPLELWSRYIQWVEENYPQGGKESDLQMVLEQCLEKLRDSTQYQSDPRLLEIYLRYLDLTENNAEWYNQLYGAGYFHKLASFYIHWAETLETCCNFKEGTRIYMLGLQNKAEPLIKLEESFKHYQARVASALFKTMTNPVPLDENNEPSRNAFGELETESKAPSIRSGTTVRKFQNNRLLPPTSTVSKGNNKPIFILDDENNPGGGTQSTLISSKVALPIQSVMKAENSLKPTKWTEAQSVVNEVVPAIPAQPSFQVHVDDDIPLPSSQRKATDGFSGALKDKSAAPTKLNPQTLFERENPKVKLMCDLNKIVVGHREFSFEEIRRQCYERSGRYPTVAATQTETPVTPISSAALLNVRSKEKSLKNRTPSDVSAITPKAKTPKIVAPPPPLKPNEKWYCDIEALYPGGRELTFEQLRAQYYAARAAASKPTDPQSPVPEAPPVEVQISALALSEQNPALPSDPIPTLRSDPIPILPCEPKKDAPTTREISVQTDLFGLDFDIQLVPRRRVASPPCKVPSPRPVEQNSPAGGSASSPTVNTKQALSSVKSWFNASVLLPEPKTEPKPARKSLFSIFKDPSMVDVPDESAPVSKSSLPKPFAVFTEPEEVAIQPKRFTIMDENAPFDQENAVSHAPSVPKVRKPLSAIVSIMPTCQENPIPEEDNFKENVPPASHVQEPVVKRQLSGILVPSVDIPCDPAGLVEEDMNTEEEEEPGAQPPHPSSGVSRALFAGDEDEQTRHYCVQLNDDVDFTVPSAMAFANNLRIQSTPLLTSRQQQPLAAVEEATFNLPRGRALQASAESAGAVSVAAPAASSRTLRGLSPIDERSREYYSSSGSSAGTTGLAHQSRLSVGRSLHCTDVARIYPPHFDPFDMDHRNTQLTQLAIPLHERNGFYPVSGRLPWLRSNSSVQLGGNQYIIKQQIGQGAYAKIYEANEEGQRLVLKVQESDGIWEYYITSELQRRLADSPTSGSVMTVSCGYFYDSGSILVNQYLPHGTLLDLINSYKLKNTSMPEPLVYHFSLQLLSIVSDMHECGILHADIKPDNILLQSPLTSTLHSSENWTAEEVLAQDKRTLKLIDFGRSIDLALYSDRTAFMHVFQDDKCPEMKDGKPWSYQLDYYGLATSIFTMLMGVHCKIIYSEAQWKVPTLKRGHNSVWRDLTTTLLNASAGSTLDLEQFRHALATQLVSSIKPREFNDKMRELERYLVHK